MNSDRKSCCKHRDCVFDTSNKVEVHEAEEIAEKEEEIYTNMESLPKNRELQSSIWTVIQQ